MMEEKKILFVDDERQILRALKRLFYKSDYAISFAEGGEEALLLLASNKFDMIISDMRMPNMDGHELLKRVKEKYPSVIRIALSGYTDKKIVLSAIDQNLVKLYMFKPWDNEEILALIDGLFEFEKMVKDANLLDVINNIEHIPTVPSLYAKISEMVNREAAIDEITGCIEEDQAIASRILRISNSAYYGSRTGSIKDAIMFIGLENVKTIILTNAVYDQRKGNARALEQIWRHSSLTNKILSLLYNRVLRKKLSSKEKSAGLLHNIGEAVLLTNNWESNVGQEIAMKMEQYSIGHEKIGGYLLNWWEFPMPIVESAMFHHEPSNPLIVNKELVCAVHLSAYVAAEFMGVEEEDEISLAALNQLNVQLDDFKKLVMDNI